MKLDELRQEVVKRFCDEHDLWYEVPGDAAIIEEGLCTKQEYYRFQALKCIGFCNLLQYRNTTDMNSDPANFQQFQKDLDFDDFHRLIVAKLMYAKGKNKDPYLWVAEKLQQIQREKFSKQTDIEAFKKKFS